MKHIFLFAILLILTAAVTAQEPAATPVPAASSAPTSSSEGPNPSVTKSEPAKLVPVQQPNWYVRPDASTRRKRYIKSMVGPVALARRVASAGYSTWRNSPEEWGTKWEGFGRRVASGF